MDKEDGVCVCVYTHTHTHTTLGYIYYIYTPPHTHNGMLLSHKKYEILPFVTTWIDLEGIMLNETSQTEKDKYHKSSLICGT